MEILAPISPGELIDKMTILEIKLVEITDSAKLKNIQAEYDFLSGVFQKEIVCTDELLTLKEELRTTNKKIWESENDVRAFWNDDALFNKGAKQSHFYNDERAKIKRQINELLGSSIIEEKSHPKYEHKI
jgi:hypothetical protein